MLCEDIGCTTYDVSVQVNYSYINQDGKIRSNWVSWIGTICDGGSRFDKKKMAEFVCKEKLTLVPLRGDEIVRITNNKLRYSVEKHTWRDN